VADSSVEQLAIVSYTNREEREESAAAHIVSDTHMTALHQWRSDSTSGTAVNTSDLNVEAQEACRVADGQHAFMSWGIVYHREHVSALRLVAHPCPY
jgi:hypothetical protein